MRVTVTETIEHSADVTREGTEAYLVAAGTVQVGGRLDMWATWGYGPAGTYVIVGTVWL